MSAELTPPALLWPRLARGAEAYLARNIQFVVPFAAGPRSACRSSTRSRWERIVAGSPGLPADILAVLSAAIPKAVTAPEVVAWGKQNDLVMRATTPEETVAIVDRQRAFFERHRSSLMPVWPGPSALA